jgi:signal transduction histidine kinase
MPETPPRRSFAELLGEEARKMKLTSSEVSFPAGRVIFEEGDAGDGLYAIDEGVVEIFTAVAGQPARVLATLEQGALFGEMAVIDDLPRSASARAKTETRAGFFPRGDIWRIIAQSPPLLIALVREVTGRMRRAAERSMQEAVEAERLAVVGRFAQSIVHDLKNPLNTIGIAADLLFSDDSTPEIRKEVGLLVRKEVDRLAGMIHEVLEFTRGTARVPELIPTDFREFMESVIEDLRPGAEARAVKVEFDNEPPAVLALVDRVRLMHVINNLANNAMDVMPSGGTIVFRFLLVEESIVIEMEDSGPGIPPEIAGHLFEPFVTHGKAHGTGLGLSICKRIVEDHKGTISVISQPGRGAVFCFSLRRKL